VLIAAASNTVVKGAIVLRAGGAFARWGAGTLGIMTLAAILGAALQYLYFRG
jgi:hypothetical protein